MTKKETSVIAESVSELTPHTKAVLAAGEDALVSSIATTREFCKSMITISFSSVPVYLALLKIFSSEEETITDIFGQFWIAPVLLSLGAACIALFGYMPGRKLVSLELPDELERFLRSAANRRFYSGILSFISLIASIFIAAGLLVRA